MDLHQDHFGVDFLQAALHAQKRIVRGIVHADPALQHDHRQGPGLGVIYAPAPAGGQGGVVRRTEDIRTVLRHGHDRALGEGVVAQGDDVRPGVEQAVGLLGVDADDGAVLAVDDAEIDAVIPLQLPQTFAEIVRSAGAYHVADGKDLKLHSRASLRFLLLYYARGKRARKKAAS